MCSSQKPTVKQEVMGKRVKQASDAHTLSSNTLHPQLMVAESLSVTSFDLLKF